MPRGPRIPRPMPTVLRRAGFALLVLGLAFFAHFAVLRAGPTGRDVGVAAALEPGALPTSAQELLPPPPPAFAAASLRALLAAPDPFAAFGLAPVGPSGAVHLANLALLLVLALAAGATARQALEPWLGADTAAWCGAATTLLLPLHPLAGASIASFEAHGVLLACALGAAASAVFLRARQVQSPLRLGAAYLLLAGSAAADRAAVVFALWIVIVEWTSTRRHRPAAARVRSAAITLASASAVVALAWLGLGEREAWELGPGSAAELATGALVTGLEKLGVLLLPGESAGEAAARLVALGALLLVVVHPALVAARSAPRSWGWFAAAACVATGAALALHPRVRVAPGELSGAHVLVPAIATFAIVLGSSATAVAGTRRKVLPILLAVAWTLHGRTLTAPWPASARAFAEFAAEVDDAARRDGPCAELWVLEEPRGGAGADVRGDGAPPRAAHAADREPYRYTALRADELAEIPRSLAWVLHPFVDAAAEGRVDRARSTRVRALDAETFVLVAREREFAHARERGLVLLAPPEFASRADDAAAPGSADEPESDVPPRSAWSLRVAAAGDPPSARIWRGDGRSELLDCEPLTVRALRVNALSTASTVDAPRLAWRARDERLDGGRATGAWLAGESGPQAWFDLAADPRWVLGRRLARVQLEGELRRIVSAELLADAPAPDAPYAFELAIVDRDVRVPAPRGALPRPLRGAPEWSLALLNPAALASARVALEPDGAGGLVARGGLATLRRALDARRDAAGELAWTLEYRVGGVTLVRLAGRRARGD